jgi:hypothetical protein
MPAVARPIFILGRFRFFSDLLEPPMTVFTDLDTRVTAAPFDTLAYDHRLPDCRAIAQTISLVHVSGRERTTMRDPPHEIPTSMDAAYCTDDTRRTERLLGLSPSAYFYAGRAHPGFGNVALAFAPGSEALHTGSATPFDTGGLVHPNRYIKIQLSPADGEAERVQYGKASEVPLERWRDVFARVLAAYFSTAADYWEGRPNPWDPEGLYGLNRDWRAWTFEIRFSEGQSIHERVAWCADESVMETLRRLQDQQEPAPPGDPATALDRFLAGPGALEPTGTPRFCARMEEWVREQIGL